MPWEWGPIELSYVPSTSTVVSMVLHIASALVYNWFSVVIMGILMSYLDLFKILEHKTSGVARAINTAGAMGIFLLALIVFKISVHVR